MRWVKTVAIIISLGLLWVAPASANFGTWPPSARSDASVLTILDGLYGLDNLEAVPDGDPGWSSIGTNVTATALYSTVAQRFGYRSQSSSDFVSLMDVGAGGFLHDASVSMRANDGQVFHFDVEEPVRDGERAAGTKLYAWRLRDRDTGESPGSPSYVLAWVMESGSGSTHGVSQDAVITRIDGVEPVPEPASMTLIGLGLLGMAGASQVRRLRRRHQRSRNDTAAV